MSRELGKEFSPWSTWTPTALLWGWKLKHVFRERATLAPKSQWQTTAPKKQFRAGPYPSTSQPCNKRPRSVEEFAAPPSRGRYVPLWDGIHLGTVRQGISYASGEFCTFLYVCLQKRCGRLKSCWESWLRSFRSTACKNCGPVFCQHPLTVKVVIYLPFLLLTATGRDSSEFLL